MKCLIVLVLIYSSNVFCQNEIRVNENKKMKIVEKEARKAKLHRMRIMLRLKKNKKKQKLESIKGT